MDPNACLERLIQAADDHDHDEVSEAASDLQEWLDTGGFMPDVTKQCLCELLTIISDYAHDAE